MDRLVCGDVGYGKTKLPFERLSRGIGGKQVAILVPTTVLASSTAQFEIAWPVIPLSLSW